MSAPAMKRPWQVRDFMANPLESHIVCDAVEVRKYIRDLEDALAGAAVISNIAGLRIKELEAKLEQPTSAPHGGLVEAMAVKLCRDKTPYDPYGPVSPFDKGPRWKRFVEDAERVLASPDMQNVLRAASPVVPSAAAEDVARQVHLLYRTSDDYARRQHCPMNVFDTIKSGMDGEREKAAQVADKFTNHKCRDKRTRFTLMDMQAMMRATAMAIATDIRAPNAAASEPTNENGVAA